MTIVDSVAHCPSSGVKVKKKLPGFSVLIIDGFHVPGMPSIEVRGRPCGVSY